MIREFSKFSYKIYQRHKLDKKLKKVKLSFVTFVKTKNYEIRRYTYRKRADES
jgi:hypothetical protein